MAVRVTGGEYRGRNLEVPGSARPTEGRVREALFSMWRDRLAGARLLDLFAGSGIVGFEAVSRGAGHVLCIDSDPRAIRAMEENRAHLGLRPGQLDIRRLSLPGGLARLAAHPDRFDLAFVDPPYNFPSYPRLIATVADLLSPDGELAVEHSSRLDLPAEAGPLVRLDTRRYGESAISLYRPASAP